MPVSIRPCEERDRLLVANIFNIYQNELSIYANDFFALDENGYFDPTTVQDILPFGGHVYPYIVFDEDGAIGFVMVTDGPYPPEECDYCFQEIFLVRAKRGGGRALQAARLAMKGRSGRWGLNVYEKNMPARAFWEKLIQRYGSNLRVQNGEENMLEMSFDFREDGE